MPDLSEKRCNAFHFGVKFHKKNEYPWETMWANDLKFCTRDIGSYLHQSNKNFEKIISVPFMLKKLSEK
jgi:hypothetical protein